MNALDRRIKRERKQMYKRLRKLFKARDMASKYLSKQLRISQILNGLRGNEDEYLFTSDLAHYIIQREKWFIGTRPPKPLIQKK